MRAYARSPFLSRSERINFVTSSMTKEMNTLLYVGFIASLGINIVQTFLLSTIVPKTEQMQQSEQVSYLREENTDTDKQSLPVMEGVISLFGDVIFDLPPKHVAIFEDDIRFAGETIRLLRQADTGAYLLNSTTKVSVTNLNELGTATDKNWMSLARGSNETDLIVRTETINGVTWNVSSEEITEGGITYQSMIYRTMRGYKTGPMLVGYEVRFDPNDTYPSGQKIGKTILNSFQFPDTN